jgi:hypothetical protein
MYDRVISLKLFVASSNRCLASSGVTRFWIFEELRYSEGRFVLRLLWIAAFRIDSIVSASSSSELSELSELYATG